MSGALARYDEACRAIAEARTIDAAKDIADRAEALRVYARQAKNRDLEIHAAEIRIRAERRLGEMLAEQKATVGLAQGRRSDLVPAGNEVRPTLAEAGIDRKLSMRAQQLAAMPEPAFAERLDAWRSTAERDGARVTVRLVQGVDKAEARESRIGELAGRQQALPDRRYGVILADPEWRFEPWSRKTGMDRAADNHYPTSATEVIAARPVASIAADDCALGLWATVPMLPQALLVMAAWGFDYRSHIVWRKAVADEGSEGERPTPSPAGRGGMAPTKLVLGTGYWFRNAHELLLLGVRGNVPAPAMGTQWPSVIDAPPRRHSEKPDVFYELFNAYFGPLAKIELNARRARPGWDAWGLEAPQAKEHEAA